MRKYITNISVLALLLGLLTQLGLAREVTVAPFTNGGDIDGLPQAILDDSTAREAALPELTTYVLENGGLYPIVSETVNEDFFLHIRTADLEGAKARLVPSPRADEGYNDFFHFRSDGLLENLIIEAMRTADPYAANRHNIKIKNNSTLKVKGCEIAHDTPGAAFSVWKEGDDDRNNLFLEDCFIHSIGHNKSTGGNGRVLGVRSNMDTLSLVNTTFFNLTDRVFRHGGTGWDIGYVKVDHCTGLTTSGWHGYLQLGKAHEVVVTNNIFFNPIAFGSHYNRVDGGTEVEQSQPEKDLMYVITLDTIFADSEITVSNNNIFWEQQYKDLWAAYPDTTTAPGLVNPTLLAANTGDPFFDEELTFVAPPPSTYDYHEAALKDLTATIYPENFYFGVAEDIDASYGTSATSYTAAAGGFPLGDLNWYPEKKAEWDAAGRPVTALIEPLSSIATQFELSQNYPNPFNPSTVINFTIPKAGNVKLAVYDALGREVEVLVDNKMNAGTYKATWNAANQATGIYFYSITTKGFSSIKKMLLVK